MLHEKTEAMKITAKIDEYKPGVSLNRDLFMRTLLVDISYLLENNLGTRWLQQYIGQVGLSMGAWIEEQYRNVCGLEGALTPQQFAEIIVDLKRRIGGEFTIENVSAKAVTVASATCPFGDIVRRSPGLCRMTSSVFGGIAARNFGYGKVFIRRSIARGDKRCEVKVFLDRSAEALSAPGDEYTREMASVPSEIEKAAPSLVGSMIEKEGLFATVLSAIADGISVQDLDWRIVYANEAQKAMFGEDIVGKRCYEVYMRRETVCKECPVQQSFRSGTPQRAVQEMVGSQGQTLEADVTAAPIRDGEGNIVASIEIFRDVTEQRKAQKKLNLALQELERSNTELQQFASVISHDLQEPLRTVTTYMQLLQKRYQDQLDQQARELIAIAADGASRMHEMIIDILQYSRVASRGKPFMPVDCNQALKQALTNLHATIEENKAVIEWKDLPTIAADSSQLVQVLQNLVGNAIKFRGQEQPRIRVDAELKDGEWFFSVKDNGIGIDPRYFERIFIIFQRLHGLDEYPGTGVGLTICKRIVERHGGRIWVESEPGHGSTFFFTMPAAGS